MSKSAMNNEYILVFKEDKYVLEKVGGFINHLSVNENQS